MRYLLMGTLLLADVAMTRPYPPVSDADIFYSITGVNMPDDYLMGADETAYSYPPLDPYPSLPSAAPTVAPLPPPLPPPSPPPPADVVRQPTWATQPQVYPALATYPQTAHLQPAYQQQPAYSIPSGFQMTPAVPGQTATLFVFVQGMPQQSYPGALVYPGQSQLVPVPVQLTPAESMEEEEEHWWSGFSWPTSDTVNKYWPAIAVPIELVEKYYFGYHGIIGRPAPPGIGSRDFNISARSEASKYDTTEYGSLNIPLLEALNGNEDS